MYSVLDLSRYIVSKCAEDGYPITNLQLQKILYCIQGYFLSQGSIAFPDAIEAWQFGPAVPDVYYHYCGCGAMPIAVTHESFAVEPEDKAAVDAIVEGMRDLMPWEMADVVQRKGGAWDRVYNNGSGSHEVIPVELMRR